MSVPVIVARPAYRMYQLAWAGLDLLFPPRCGGCGQLGARWCESCLRAVQPVPKDNICIYCGQIMNTKGVCRSCRHSRPPYVALRSWAIYGGVVQKVIHQLKYEGNMALGEQFAKYLISLLISLQWKPDLVVPVPLGLARRAERGYNQSALLALPLALYCNLVYRPQALSRVRETRTQVGLDASQRRENVAQAFHANPRWVRGKVVLVVDDVITTGATMAACANALHLAGASKVFGLSMARPSILPV